MERVVSGMRPTGKLHLGNYFGAAVNFVKMQHEYDCYFFIADYHSLTTHPEASELRDSVRGVLASYLACGLDPNLVTLYVQSHLPQIPELYLMFNMIAYKGELEKCPSFKDKVREQSKSKKSINAGLLTYPVLMAVDIIIHKALKVPVGKDQEAHLEMARDFVNRFNHMVGEEYFPEPHGFNYGGALVKVPSLDGEGKMSKSNPNPNSAIYLSDSDEVIIKKVKKTKTDSGPTEENQEKPEIIQNVFDLMSLVSSQEVIQFYEDQYNNVAIRYGDMKKQLAEDMVNFIKPIRERYEDILADEAYMKKVVREGGEKARASAEETLRGAKELFGLTGL